MQPNKSTTLQSILLYGNFKVFDRSQLPLATGACSPVGMSIAVRRRLLPRKQPNLTAIAIMYVLLKVLYVNRLIGLFERSII